jgi:hypothetical protein
MLRRAVRLLVIAAAMFFLLSPLGHHDGYGLLATFDLRAVFRPTMELPRFELVHDLRRRHQASSGSLVAMTVFSLS